MALSVLAVIFRNRSIMRETTSMRDGDETEPLLPTPLSNFNGGDTPYYLPQNDHSLYYRKFKLLKLSKKLNFYFLF